MGNTHRDTTTCNSFAAHTMSRQNGSFIWRNYPDGQLRIIQSPTMSNLSSQNIFVLYFDSLNIIIVIKPNPNKLNDSRLLEALNCSLLDKLVSRPR